MRSLVVLVVPVLAATAADAQLLGSPPVAVGATGQVGVTVPNPLPPVIDTARTTVRETTHTAHDLDARDKGAVQVSAGASIRVDRGTRCYYDDYYYDPYFRDGYYYCERRGTEAGAGMKVKKD